MSREPRRLVVEVPAELAERLERRCSPIRLERFALLALEQIDRTFDLQDRRGAALDVDRGRS
jgi:hypothetical protein